MLNEKKPFFPIYLNLSEERVIVVGAGTIAKRRIRTLINYTNHLVVIAPEVNRELKLLEEKGQLTILKKHVAMEDLDGAALVIAASSENKINRAVSEYCQANRIPVNVCNTREKSDFYFSSLVQKDEIVIGVSSSGKNPAKGRAIAAKIREMLNIEETEE